MGLAPKSGENVMKKITVLGVGYVGLVTGTCLAELGNEVVCVDIDLKRIETLRKGVMPIYEEGLEEMVKKNVKEKRLFFTTDAPNSIKKSEIVFIAVGTPTLPDGTVHLEYVKLAAETIGKSMNDYKVLVNKSTVPIGTGDTVTRIIKKYYSGKFDVVSNPEFLREGTAVFDFMNPDRIVIGNGAGVAKKIMLELYAPLNAPIVNTNIKTAEMIKYASNALLATEISFINSVANICEKMGADVSQVSEGMKLDKRIGKHAFLNAGIGYGGSCFPKDVKALIQIAQENGVRFNILEAVEDTNEAQKQSMLRKIQHLLGDNLVGKRIAIWGLAFKPKTDDIREAPSLVLIKQLLDRDVHVIAFDPIAEEQARKILKDKIEYGQDYYETVKDVDCLVVVTEWPEFQGADLGKMKNLMKAANVVDGRNVFDKAKMEEAGFKYISVGR